jgi:glycosyltransferase involved in cell wall biosynthesis
MNKRIVAYKTDHHAPLLTPESVSGLTSKLDAASRVSEARSGRMVAPQRVFLYLKHFPALGLPLRVGTNKAVHGLASGLVANGVPAEVWCEGERDSEVTMPEGYVIRCFATRASYRTFRIAPSLSVHLQTLQPERDLVVLNGMFHPSVYAMSRKLKSRDIPYVVAPHGPYHPTLFTKNPHLKWPYWYLVERSVLKNALALQQLDKRHEVWARRLGIGIPVVATENGFLDSDIPPEDELHWRMRGPVRALFWGRMDIHTKGLDVLLAGFNRVARKQPMFLTLQGPDWTGEAPAVKRLVDSLETADDIEMLPPVFDVAAPRVMLSHDIICMPSRFEGFGLAALEAMLAGRVLLVSSTAGIAPHIQKCGCGVVVDASEHDVQRGLEQLLAKRREWAEMGLRGRAYALENLHWNRIAARTLVQYRQLLDARLGSRSTSQAFAH